MALYTIEPSPLIRIQ